MPLFEYVCEDCGAQNEILVRGGERPACPKCDSRRLVKQASAFAPGRARGGASSPPCGSADGPCCATGTCPYQS